MHSPLRIRNLLIAFIATGLLAFSVSEKSATAQKTLRYYDRNMYRLEGSLRILAQASNAHTSRDSLLRLFYICRNTYKKTELFTDVFTPYKARILNGPDILKIDEENPSDSMEAHGLQVMERILFSHSLNRKELYSEAKAMEQEIRVLRNNPDRKYYFNDEKVWTAIRLASFRIVSLGITGFDVPMSHHAVPETKIVLNTIREISSYYRGEISVQLWHTGDSLLKRANTFLSGNTSFNSLDRLTFIRDYMNPLSEWITQISLKYCSAATARYPLTPGAGHLFTRDIMNITFFSPSDDYLSTPQRAYLGKKLFYDPILSGDGSRTCASCHKPELAFTDGTAKPMDISGKKELLRNTPTLWNAALQTAQFYDSRARILERQLNDVVHNQEEMNGSLLRCIPSLNADTLYARLFKSAYPNEPVPVTEYTISNAICSYVRTLISFDSRFDKYMRRESDSFTNGERNGFNLFMGKAGCGTCHYAPMFNGQVPPLYQETESEILGVPAQDKKRLTTPDTDMGKYLFTRHPLHRYAFKTPTVRNIALTAPYMHNGAFKTLESVIDFYNDGGGAGRGMEIPTQTLPADSLNLTQKEKQDIIAFLNTLTDTTTIDYDYTK